MTEHDYFDSNGHLTDHALTELISGEPSELHRLEIAEHLSFCDACTERYTALLCEEALLEPPESLAPSVLSLLKQRARVIFFNRYFSAGLAACLALIFWVTGVFTPALTQGDIDRETRLNELSSFSQKFSDKTAELGRGLTDGINNFFSNFTMRGANSNEKE